LADIDTKGNQTEYKDEDKDWDKATFQGMTS